MKIIKRSRALKMTTTMLQAKSSYCLYLCHMGLFSASYVIVHECVSVCRLIPSYTLLLSSQGSW